MIDEFEGDSYYRERVLDREGKKLARDSSRKATDNSARISNLESKLETLSLITEAMWELLNKNHIEQSELIEMIVKVKDRKKDKAKEKLTCNKCNMTVPATLDKCMYCGGHLDGEPYASPFEL